MAATASFTRVQNPFSPPEEWERWTVPPGGKLLEYLPRDFKPFRPYSLTVVNGRGLKAAELRHYVLAPGDVVELVHVPAGAIAVPLIVGTILGAVSFGASLALNQSPRFRREYHYDAQTEFNPARGWQGIQTVVGPGRPIPLVFGEVRCGGQLLESFYEPRFDLNDFANDTGVTEVPVTQSAAAPVTKLCSRVGYCVGPVESISSIEVDGNPIENVKGTVYEVKLGTNRDRAPDGFTESKAITEGGSLPATVTNAGGPVVTQTDSEVDTVEVKITFTAGLYEVDGTDGRPIPRSVDIKFEYKKASAGSYTNYGTLTVEQANPAPHIVWVRFPRLAFAQYDIRVTRVTSDTADPDVEDVFQWTLMQEVRSAVRTHPGIAEVAYRQIPLEQQPVPRDYTAVVKGVNTIRVYSHPGAYTVGWSNNPAWCLAWFLTDPENGLGKFFNWDNIPLEEFCAFADDCDEMVDNGRGGKEKRATFNHEFNEIESSQDIIRKFTEGTRAFPADYHGGKWHIVLDVPGSSKVGFNEGNIIDGSLSSQFLPTYQRPTRVLANFLNEERSYKQDPFLQEDPTLEEGEYPTDLVTSFSGVTSPAQMAWLCLREIEKARLRNKMVELQAGIEAYRLRPGDLVDVASVSAGIGIASGKVLEVSSDKSTLKVDDDLLLDDTKTYEITVYHKIDGRSQSKLLTGISTDPTQHVTVGNTLWSVLPQAGDGYTIGEVTLSKEQFRVLEISEDATFKRRIKAELYAEVSEAIISNPPVDELDSLSPRILPPAVENLTALEINSADSGSDTRDEVLIGWENPLAAIVWYEVWYKPVSLSSRGWRQSPTLVSIGAANSYIWNELHGGISYDIRIVGVTRDGTRTPLSESAAVQISL